MTTATVQTNTRRRDFLALTAAVATTVMAARPARALAQRVPDPIYAVIEAHKVAAATALAAVRRNSAFEDELYANERLQTERRLENEHARQEEIDAAIDQAHYAEQVAAYALLDVNPTTMAGVIALLTYAIEHDDREHGMGWPDSISFADESGSRSWEYFLIDNLASILPEIMQVSA